MVWIEDRLWSEWVWKGIFGDRVIGRFVLVVVPDVGESDGTEDCVVM